MSVYTHVSELLPAYALGCLDQEEYTLVARHLEGCSACQLELESYQETVDNLALAAPEVSPAPDLKQRLMERIQPPAAVEPRVAKPRVKLPRTGRWQAFMNSLRRTAPVWAAAGLLLLLVLAVSNLWLWQRVRQLEDQARSSGLRTITLTHTETAPQATGMIVVGPSGWQGTLVVDGLPPLEPDRQYQLWLIRNGERDSGAVFSVNDYGYWSAPIAAPGPIADYSAFGISIEPAGGSLTPTGARVLGGAIN